MPEFGKLSLRALKSLTLQRYFSAMAVSPLAWLGVAGVDGPLSVVLTNKGLNKKQRKEAWGLSKLHPVSSGFFPSLNFFYQILHRDSSP
jgi:hypothetical protein